MKIWKWTERIRAKKKNRIYLLFLNKSILVLEISVIGFSQGIMWFASHKSMFHILEKESLAWKCWYSLKYGFISSTLIKRTKPNLFKQVSMICIRWVTTGRSRGIKSLIAFTKETSKGVQLFWGSELLLGSVNLNLTTKTFLFFLNSCNWGNTKRCVFSVNSLSQNLGWCDLS